MDGLPRRDPPPKVGPRDLQAGNLDRAPGPIRWNAVAGVARSIDHDDLDQIAELVGPMPGVQAGSSVRSDDQRDLGAGSVGPDLLDGVDGVGRPVSPQLDVGDDQPVDPDDGGLDQTGAERPDR